MARRKDERRVNFVAGLFVVGFMGLVMLSVFLIAKSEGLLEAKTTIAAHFRTVGGLRTGSPVQLGGTKIGDVTSTDFISPSYVCDPVTEDSGQLEGRTDVCDPSLFCAPNGLCAEFEPYTGNPTSYQSCASDDTCAAEQVCLNDAFRRRYRRVQWTGPQGWCVPYSTVHRRIHVTMEISADKLRFIRDDSRATIAQNGVLGDQLINVTVGTGAPIPEGGRIQAAPSIMEEIAYFRERLELITDKVGNSLSGVAGLFDSLNDDRTKRDLRGLLANTNEITRQIKDGDGLVGALFNDPQYRAEFGATLRSVRRSIEEIEAASVALRGDLEPTLRETSKAAAGVAAIVSGLQDPNNKSLVARAIHDPELGESAKRVVTSADEALVAAKTTMTEAQATVAEVRQSIETGEGTLGKLLNDPKAYNDLLKVLGNIERNTLLKKFTRFVIQRDEPTESARPDGPVPAGSAASED
ncbi:MAG: hypothetical protein B7733_09195 [Myxococcales bacterium FL481]|nr:MAG: hypothetical protein B7733_09195 [Myxococcales bacterium FL481]